MFARLKIKIQAYLLSLIQRLKAENAMLREKSRSA